MDDIPVALLKQTLDSIGAEIEEVKTNQKQIITSYLATTGNANTTAKQMPIQQLKKSVWLCPYILNLVPQLLFQFMIKKTWYR